MRFLAQKHPVWKLHELNLTFLIRADVSKRHRYSWRCASGGFCEIKPSGALTATVNGQFNLMSGTQTGVLVDLISPISSRIAWRGFQHAPRSGDSTDEGCGRGARGFDDLDVLWQILVQSIHIANYRHGGITVAIVQIRSSMDSMLRRGERNLRSEWSVRRGRSDAAC